MKREEEIKYLIQDVWEDYRYKGYEAFEEVALKLINWADEHPKNPWISVKDRLPVKLENDCTSYYVLTRVDGPRHVWYLVNRYNYDKKTWEGCNNNTTHWIPIPELKGE